MIEKKKFKLVLNVLATVLFFTLLTTGVTAETLNEQAEKKVIVSYGSCGYEGGSHKIFVFFDDNENIVERLLGDINGDDKVTVTDARIALRVAVGVEVLTDEDEVVADVDYDSKVTINDARTILRVSVQIQYFDHKHAHLRPETLGEALEDINLSRITSVIVYYYDNEEGGKTAKLNSDDDVAYIINVLDSNTDVETYLGWRSIDFVIPPAIIHEISDIQYPSKRIVLKSDIDKYFFFFYILKDLDGDTWIWGYFDSASWAIKLENNSDAYDIIVGMLSE